MILDKLTDKVTDTLTRTAVRAALIGGSLASGNLFWVRATLGENQLRMHDCAPDGTISIGGVSEQLYGDGFMVAWHEVLERELDRAADPGALKGPAPDGAPAAEPRPGTQLGARASDVMYEVGYRGAVWEVSKAIELKVWVPALLRPLVGRKELVEKVRGSAFYHALMKESLRILFRMIMTEGGWGVIEEIDLRSTPMRVVVANAPEARHLEPRAQCSCWLTSGIYAGYFGTIFGVPAIGVETTCRARGDRACTFEITLAAAKKTETTESAEPTFARSSAVSASSASSVVPSSSMN